MFGLPHKRIVFSWKELNLVTKCMERFPTFALGGKYQWRRGATQNIADIKKQSKLWDNNTFRRLWNISNKLMFCLVYYLV